MTVPDPPYFLYRIRRISYEPVSPFLPRSKACRQIIDIERLPRKSAASARNAATAVPAGTSDITVTVKLARKLSGDEGRDGCRSRGPYGQQVRER